MLSVKLLVFLGVIASVGGDDSCWDRGLSYDFCCGEGSPGPPECWDRWHSFDFCCEEPSTFDEEAQRKCWTQVFEGSFFRENSQLSDVFAQLPGGLDPSLLTDLHQKAEALKSVFRRALNKLDMPPFSSGGKSSSFKSFWYSALLSSLWGALDRAERDAFQHLSAELEAKRVPSRFLYDLCCQHAPSPFVDLCWEGKGHYQLFFGVPAEQWATGLDSLQQQNFVFYHLFELFKALGATQAEESRPNRIGDALLAKSKQERRERGLFLFDESSGSEFPEHPKFLDCCFPTLKKKLSRKPESWMALLIREGLAPWRDSPDVVPTPLWASIENLSYSEGFVSPQELCRFSFKNQRISHCNFSEEGRSIWDSLLAPNKAFHLLSRYTKLPDVEFFYSSAERQDDPLPVPTFVLGRTSPFAWNVLLGPSFDLLTQESFGGGA